MSAKFIKAKKIVVMGLTALMCLGSAASFWELPESELDNIALNPLSVTVYAADLSGQFTDQIPQWASSDISYLVDKGIMKGYEDGSFRAQNTMTRMEFVTAVVRSLMTDAEIEACIKDPKWNFDEGDGPMNMYDVYCDEFTQSVRTHRYGVPSELGESGAANFDARTYWGTKYAFIATYELKMTNGIDLTGVGGTDGSSTEVRVGANWHITRQEACQIMRYACEHGNGETLNKLKGIQNIINGGAGGVGSSYQDSVERCVSNGLIAGVDSNYTIAAKKALTRAEACSIIARITDKSRRLSAPVIPEDKQTYSIAEIGVHGMDEKTITNKVTGEAKTMAIVEWDTFLENNYPSYRGTNEGETSKDGWYTWNGIGWQLVD